MKIVAIDPGPKESSIVLWDGEKIIDASIETNENLVERIPLYSLSDFLVIEKIECFGMPVGIEVFETVFWSGRFCQAWGKDYHLISRREVKLHLCSSLRAKDSNIRQALIDRFGPPGTKKKPGTTYGLKRDLWQAFALAVVFFDQKK